jgi:hypothetical protein
MEILKRKNPSIRSTKNYEFYIHFNKKNLLVHSNIFFMKISENFLLNNRFSMYNHNHHCLNNQSEQFILIDPTNTFEIDQKRNLIWKKYLNIKQQRIYQLTLQQIPNNRTNAVSY